MIKHLKKAKNEIMFVTHILQQIHVENPSCNK
jgi:hypothetical protein